MRSRLCDHATHKSLPNLLGQREKERDCYGAQRCVRGAGKNCACNGLVLTTTGKNQIGDNGVNAPLRSQMAFPASVAVGGCFSKIVWEGSVSFKAVLVVLTI